MASWRKLWSKITESEDVNEMPNDTYRLTWALLMFALDSEGRSQDTPALIRAKLYPLREDLTKADIQAHLDWFAEHKMIIRYEVDGKKYFYQSSFNQYQGSNKVRREAKSLIPAPPDYVAYEETPEEVQTDSLPDPEPYEEPIVKSAQPLVKSSECIVDSTTDKIRLDKIKIKSKIREDEDCAPAVVSTQPAALNVSLSNSIPQTPEYIVPLTKSDEPAPPWKPDFWFPKGIPDDRQLTSPEIYDFIERTYKVWTEISHQPSEHDKEKIAQWGRLFGHQHVLDTFEKARGKLHTWSEIYNSIDTAAT